MEVHSAMETVFWQVVFKLHWKTWEMEYDIPFDWLYYKIVIRLIVSQSQVKICNCRIALCLQSFSLRKILSKYQI